jgi:hypothetical protein
MKPRGRHPAGEIRQRDGARKQCPEHPDADLYQGYTRAGNLRTWCTVEGCPCAAEWVPQATKEAGR